MQFSRFGGPKIGGEKFPHPLEFLGPENKQISPKSRSPEAVSVLHGVMRVLKAARPPPSRRKSSQPQEWLVNLPPEIMAL